MGVVSELFELNMESSNHLQYVLSSFAIVEIVLTLSEISQKWIDEQIETGVLQDDIVDEVTAIRYLSYSATRPLLDSHGRLKDGKGQLSAVSLNLLKVCS